MLTSPIILPTTKSPATRKSPQMTVIYGPPKIGKTTVMSELEGNLIVDIEDGADFIEALKIKANNWEKLQAVCQAIRDNGRPYKYGTLDTASRMEEWAEKEATRRYKLMPIGKTFRGQSVLELDHGAGYLHLRNAFTDMIMCVKSTFPNVIFVCHLRDKMLAGKEAKSNTEVASKDLDLTGKCKQIICSLADAIGYIYRKPDSSKLWINFCSNETVNCGSRCQHLKGTDMELSWDKIFID